MYKGDYAVGETHLDDDDALGWPIERLGEGIEELCRRSRLPFRSGEPLALPGHITGRTAELDRWISWVGSRTGLEIEAVDTTLAGLDDMIAAAGPAILSYAGATGPRFLLLLKSRVGRPRIIAPDLTVKRVSPEDLHDLIAYVHEKPLYRDIDELLALTKIPPERRATIRKVMAGEKLATQKINGFWLLRLPASAPFGRQLVEARLPQKLGLMVGLFVIVYSLEILGWGLIGNAALNGRSDIGWLLAWALMMMSIIPFRLVGHALDGSLAISIGRLFKTRLLAGGLNLDIEQVRHEGVGQMMARVMESQAFEAIAVQGGFAALVALVELALSAFILAKGAGGGFHVLLLVIWLGVSIAIGLVYARRLGTWTTSRLTLTDRLVERMVGHRTALAQEQPERRDARNDRDMKDYLGTSRAMDRSVLPFIAGIPAGWMILGLLGLAPAFISSSNNLSGLAVSLGGILFANRAFAGIAGGIAAAARAGIAWQQIGPMFRAAARPVSNLPFVAGATTPALAGSRLVVADSLVFGYGDRQDPVLKGASLTINHGDRILLEGRSGGGKSTLSSLLVGLRKPQSGLLLLNSLDHHTLGSAWHRLATEAPQFHENHILSGTLGFNLLMGRGWPATDADLAEARALCEDLGLGDLIERMPSGLMQTVGETGWQLSHGEKSRIFLARALLQDADLTILDESFAALDPETLERCMATVLKRARTVIVVAHP